MATMIRDTSRSRTRRPLKIHIVLLAMAMITFLSTLECSASGASGCIDKVEDLWFNKGNQEAAIDTLESCILSGRLRGAKSAELERRVFPRMERWFSVTEEPVRFTEMMVYLAEPKNRPVIRRVFGTTPLWQQVEEAYEDYDTPMGELRVLPEDARIAPDSTVEFEIYIRNRLEMPLGLPLDYEIQPDGAGDFNRETREFTPYQDGDMTLTIWPGRYPDLKKSIPIQVLGPPEPSIGKFSPEQAFPGQHVWIYGSGFDAWRESIEVRFGRFLAEDIEIYADSIRVFVPDDVGPGRVVISIKFSSEPSLKFDEHFVVLSLMDPPSQKRALALTGVTVACGGGAAIYHGKSDESENGNRDDSEKYENARNFLICAAVIGTILTIVEWRRYWDKGREYEKQVEKLHAGPLVRWRRDYIAAGLTLRF